MFERYTEDARRTIFFARFEASQFGSSSIETEHLLLALLREDMALATRFLPSQADAESIRAQIEAHLPPPKTKMSTSVDLPLSDGCKRVLRDGADEAKRLNHQHIGTEHLLLGLLRQDQQFAARLLHEQGLTLDAVREQLQQPSNAVNQPATLLPNVLERWVAELNARGGVRAVRQDRVADRTTLFAIYGVEPPKETEQGENVGPAEKLAQVQRRIDSIVSEMERAIATHDFEKARIQSNEERRERENLRQLREQFKLDEPARRVPSLCLDLIGDDSFFDIQKRCDDYLAAGVSEVWLLNPRSKRAYTVTKGTGLREFKGEILQATNLPVELDLRRIFHQD